MAASAAGQLPVASVPAHASPFTQKTLVQPTMLIGEPPFGQSAEAGAGVKAVVFAMAEAFGVGVGAADDGVGALVVGAGVATDWEFKILQP